MKKLTRVALAAVLAVSLAACGNKATTEETVNEGDVEQEAQQLDGGWEVSDEAVTSLLSDEQAEIFQKAVGEMLGVDYEPVAVIGQQVVAGMNYAYLCKTTVVTADPQPEWAVVVIYAPLDGDPSFTSAVPIDLADVHVLSETDAGLAVGAWETPEATTAATLPDDVAAALDALNAEGTYKLVPQALLGSQLVAGNNYQVLCIGNEAAAEDGKVHVYDVTFYIDLEGNASTTSVEMLDLVSYVNAGE